MLGEIFRRERNLTFNYFTVTRERAQNFDFSVSFYTEGFGFALKIPPPLPRWMSLIFPFAIPVWIAIGVTLLIVAFALFFFQRCFDQRLKENFGTTFIFLLKVHSLLNQSAVDTKIRSTSHAAFAMVWWLGSFILAISYTCNFIAVLTVAKFPARILLTKQLAKSDVRLLMLDYGEFVPEALRTSQDSILHTLGSKLDLEPYLPDAEDYNYGTAVKMVLEGTHAHIETYSYLKLLYADFGVADRVYFMKEQVYNGNLAFFFPKRTPWKPIFDSGIQRMIEAGLIAKWYEDIMTQEMGATMEVRLS
ncbi:UNVERIFIED_CONTAM: hypothetical protein GTU68_022538 [Idotea baltica]|nr:hypothetical protein [Idotea baltica]